MKKIDQLSSSGIKFLGEQDGMSERKLKTHLIDLFSVFNSVVRAYLVRVDYGNLDEFNVALCIRTEDESSCDITNEINRIFADMFRADEHLDVLYLTEEKEAALSEVCSPFFKRG